MNIIYYSREVFKKKKLKTNNIDKFQLQSDKNHTPNKNSKYGSFQIGVEVC